MTIRRRLFTSSELNCRAISLREVRALDRIPSGYRTRTVLRLETYGDQSQSSWKLCTEQLDHLFVKQYDDGDPEDWLEPYGETAPLETLRFVAAWSGEQFAGLLTWSELRWNKSVWLVDIRARETRRGVGSALLGWLQAQARIIGVRGISVETQITNYPAVQFYLKHGFRVAGFHDHLYSNDDLADQDVALYLFWECDY